MEALLGLFLGAIITYWVLKYIKIQKRKDMTNAQSAFSHRALMNKKAALGKWDKDLEN